MPANSALALSTNASASAWLGPEHLARQQCGHFFTFTVRAVLLRLHGPWQLVSP